VRYAHIDVVDHSAELVRGQGSSASGSGRTEKDEIFDLVVLDFARAEDGVFETGRYTERHTETHRRILLAARRLPVTARAANDSPYLAFASGAVIR
jgi:hypothetical protein